MGKNKDRKPPTLPAERGKDFGKLLKSLPRWALKAIYEKEGNNLFYTTNSNPKFVPAYLSAYFQKLYNMITLINYDGQIGKVYRYDWANHVYRPDGTRFIGERVARALVGNISGQHHLLS